MHAKKKVLQNNKTCKFKILRDFSCNYLPLYIIIIIITTYFISQQKARVPGAVFFYPTVKCIKSLHAGMLHKPAVDYYTFCINQMHIQ